MMAQQYTKNSRDELRHHWNKFDPIGVYQNLSKNDTDWPDNEYESYYPHTFKLLAQGADDYKFLSWLEFTVTKVIGLGWDETSKIAGLKFIADLRTWYQKEQSN